MALGPPLLIGNVVSLTVFRRRKATQRAGNASANSVAGCWKFKPVRFGFWLISYLKNDFTSIFENFNTFL